MSTPPTSRPTARLAALGLSLPVPPKPVAAYVPWKRVGNDLYIAGQIPFAEGKLLAAGIVPEPISLDLARACARQCALNALAIIADALGSLDAVDQVVRLGVFVACGPAFVDHPKVANGASELMVEVFGEAGRHARAAVGASSLPLGAPVEVEMLIRCA
ncbi:MAG: RidA family protein [Planctomycetota bacterium]|nr:RidA family protein [Planctomycetota bacterium]